MRTWGAILCILCGLGGLISLGAGHPGTATLALIGSLGWLAVARCGER